MQTTTDVIVVGAGPSGSTAAYRLAERGARVIMVDRARFPRDKPCGGGVTMRGAQLLPFAIDPVVERRVERVTVTHGHHGRSRHIDGGGPMVLMTQRRRLDAFLVEQAVGQGVEFHDNVRVRAIDMTDDGVRIVTDTGTIEARILVGADGANGATRAALGVPEPSYAVALEGNLPRGATDFDDSKYLDDALLEFGTVPGGYGWIFPKGDHCNFGVGGWFAEGPNLRDHLAELCTAHGISMEDLIHLRGHRLPIRRSGTPVAISRAVLVGDAAGLVDPFSGDGMYEAFLSSKLATNAIGEFLDGRASDLSAYPDELGIALGPHVAGAWVAKLIIERAPSLMMGVLRVPRMRNIVGRRMRQPHTDRSAFARRTARTLGRRARRALGPHAA